MTEKEAKAIKWIKNVRDDAVVTLDHIQKNEPNVSPMLYEGRKQKAETIMQMYEELLKYRAIGTVEQIKANTLTKDEVAWVLALVKMAKEYVEIGTVGEFKALKEKSVAKSEWQFSRKEDVATCKACSYEHYLGTYHQYATNYCPNCGCSMYD